MDDKLEITLRITLNRPGLEQQLKRRIENDTAFFVLGLVHAQLTSTFGDEHCVVEMESGTGLNPALVRAMNSFARRHKRALEALDADGEVMVEDRDVLEVFQTLHDVIITPLGSRWRVVRMPSMQHTLPGERSKAPKN
jgi:hypothetical protein